MAKKVANKKEKSRSKYVAVVACVMLFALCFGLLDIYEMHKGADLKEDDMDEVLREDAEDDVIMEQVIICEEDNLLQVGSTKYEMAFNKGDSINIKFTIENQASSFIIKNLDSGNDLFAIRKPIGHIDTVIGVRFPAVYQLSIRSSQKQYADIKITNLNQRGTLHSSKVIRDTVMCEKGDEGAIAFKGVDFSPVYKGPQKNTMSPQGKSLFGGRSRVVIPVNLPKGTSVWAYQLRISTSRQEQDADGQFVYDMKESYRKIKIFGIPTYESNKKGTSIVRELLNSMMGPDREEDAFCDFYVFTDRREAEKFANGVADYKCYREYSLQGTQSTQGDIPCGGKTSFFIGLENTRFTTTVYTWIDAVATIPSTRYYKINFLRE